MRVLEKKSGLGVVASVLLGLGLLGAGGTAQAQIKIGVTLSSTGPAASLGIPEKNTIALLPKEMGGKSVEYIVLDDATDVTHAVQNMRKLTSEDHVDAVIGSSVTPNALAMTEVAAETHTPVISLAASAGIIEPMDAKRAWVFKVPQNDSLMANAIAQHMAQHGVKSVGFIGFSDGYGESWLSEFTKAAGANHLQLVDVERYNRGDTSVTGQILKLTSASPDAVLIAGSGTPAALPESALKDRGYKGKIYQTHGVANNDFLRVCGKACEGTFLPAGPLLVSEQLPVSNAVKVSATTYREAYEKVYGAGSIATFGGHAWDAGQMLNRAVPVALKTAQPGTPEFRAALRTALENVKDLPLSHGIMNTTPQNHNGLDERARVMVEIVDGKWKLQQ